MNILGWIAFVISVFMIIVDVTSDKKPGIRLTAVVLDFLLAFYIIATLYHLNF